MQKTSRVDGNVNFYAVNQFKSPFHKGVHSMKSVEEVQVVEATEPECNPCSPACFDFVACDEW